MPIPRKTQKEISRSYWGNLLYSRFHRYRRWKATVGLFAFCLGTLFAIAYFHFEKTKPRLEWLDSSGPISRSHAGFARDCKQCHEVQSGTGAAHLASGSSIDSSCMRCHAQHTFHEPNDVVDHSCISCHHEHLGSGPMKPVADVNCRTCHGDAANMAASAQRAAQLPWKDFLVVPKDNQVYFQPPRSPNGYTAVIHSFGSDHPEFQIQRDHLTDPNTLKFDHKIHLNGDIPMVNGKKLDCAYCHQANSQGAYMQPINFARNCQACHALQIDPTLPGFQIPHPTSGNGQDNVRNFLLTLPTQYTVYASQHMDELHLADQTQVAAFVNKHMLAIQKRTRDGDDLVKDVFYSDARQLNPNDPSPVGSRERALFPGCAYCHEVKISAGGEPMVTKPVTPDRWYIHSRFDHASHRTVSCEACHSMARQSEKTSDILLPDKASCAACHGAKGGVVSTCVTCHGYHNTDPTSASADVPALRKMMVGGQ